MKKKIKKITITILTAAMLLSLFAASSLKKEVDRKEISSSSANKETTTEVPMEKETNEKLDEVVNDSTVDEDLHEEAPKVNEEKEDNVETESKTKDESESIVSNNDDDTNSEEPEEVENTTPKVESKPEPTPTPKVESKPEPTPTPKPEPQLNPAPTLKPTPTPTPKPEPIPTPAPAPKPVPAPKPTPVIPPTPPQPQPIITTKEEIVEEVLEFKVVEEVNETLRYLEQKVQREGVVGKKTTVYTITYVDGKESKREVKNTTIIDPIDKIIQKGYETDRLAKEMKLLPKGYSLGIHVHPHVATSTSIYTPKGENIAWYSPNQFSIVPNRSIEEITSLIKFWGKTREISGLPNNEDIYIMIMEKYMGIQYREFDYKTVTVSFNNLFILKDV